MRIQCGYLPLPKGVVQRIVDLRRRDAKPRGRRPVNDEIGFEAALLLIGTDVGHHRRMFQRLDKQRRPLEQLIGIVGLKRVLIFRIALTAAGADILDRG